VNGAPAGIQCAFTNVNCCDRNVVARRVAYVGQVACDEFAHDQPVTAADAPSVLGLDADRYLNRPDHPAVPPGPKACGTVTS
jgi:hypothetical protein